MSKNHNQKAKEKPDVEVEQKVKVTGKVTWLKLDGESEIELADTPALNKKADELGWNRKNK